MTLLIHRMIDRRKMQHDYTITAGLDLGTSAIKGVLLDNDGTVLHSAERATRYAYPRPGWVEADAETWFQDVAAVLRELAQESPGPIRALAASGASGNTLLADASGTPLTPVINWMDQRCVGALPSTLKGLNVREVREVTGWPCIDSFPLAHIAWLREKRPAVFSSAARICMNTDWLIFRLTGQWAMDYSTATTFHLQDQANRRWHRPFLDRLGIREEQLSPLTGSGVPVGRITSEAAQTTGLPPETEIRTGCFDHPSAARAVGAVDPGSLLLSCGTSWVGFFPDPDRRRILDAECLCDPFLSDRDGPWGAMFSVPRIGQTVEAYVHEIIAPDEADPYRIFNEAAAEAAPGAGGLVLDLREPARPMAGSRENISRAVMEGAARLLNEKLQALREKGFVFRSAAWVGGPTRSPVWADIVRNITTLNLQSGSPHAGAEGAARLAGAKEYLVKH